MVLQRNSASIRIINPTVEIIHKDLKDVYFGLGVQKQLHSIDESEERQSSPRMKCKNFFVQACVCTRKRHFVNEKIMTKM